MAEFVPCTKVDPSRRMPSRFVELSIPRPMSFVSDFTKISAAHQRRLLPVATLDIETPPKRDARKRSRNCTPFTSQLDDYLPCAIVIYPKPRKHDLVEDFLTLRI